MEAARTDAETMRMRRASIRARLLIVTVSIESTSQWRLSLSRWSLLPPPPPAVKQRLRRIYRHNRVHLRQLATTRTTTTTYNHLLLLFSCCLLFFIFVSESLYIRMSKFVFIRRPKVERRMFFTVFVFVHSFLPSFLPFFFFYCVIGIFK